MFKNYRCRLFRVAVPGSFIQNRVIRVLPTANIVILRESLTVSILVSLIRAIQLGPFFVAQITGFILQRDQAFQSANQGNPFCAILRIIAHTTMLHNPRQGTAFCQVILQMGEAKNCCCLWIQNVMCSCRNKYYQPQPLPLISSRIDIAKFSSFICRV